MQKSKSHSEESYESHGSIYVPELRGTYDALKDELEAEREKVKDYQNQLIYLQADIENYRKRVNKDFAELTKYGSQQLIMKFLPIIDDLEYAIEAGKNSKRDRGLLEGVEMVLKKVYENVSERL